MTILTRMTLKWYLNTLYEVCGVTYATLNVEKHLHIDYDFFSEAPVYQEVNKVTSGQRPSTGSFKVEGQGDLT